MSDTTSRGPRDEAGERGPAPRYEIIDRFAAAIGREPTETETLALGFGLGDVLLWDVRARASLSAASKASHPTAPAETAAVARGLAPAEAAVVEAAKALHAKSRGAGKVGAVSINLGPLYDAVDALLAATRREGTPHG